MIILQETNQEDPASKNWKKAGKPSSRSDPTRLAYCSARANLQRIRRYEDNLQSIKQNHHLMQSNKNNRNKVYECMKKARGEKSSSETSLLFTPVGQYLGDDVLETSTIFVSSITALSSTSLLLKIRSKSHQWKSLNLTKFSSPR